MNAPRGNKIRRTALTRMLKKFDDDSRPDALDDDSRTRAAARLKQRERQEADAPVAMAEYRAAQRAALQRMHELRRLRLAREAELAGKH